MTPPTASPPTEQGAASARPADTLGRHLSSLRVSVTDRCNFRCPYCMPKDVFGEKYAFLSSAQLLSFEEIARLVRIFTRLGVGKFRLTGGEPLVRAGLHELVAELVRIEGVRSLSLTTNGYLLEQHAPALQAAGLHRVTVSLDSLDPKIAGQLNGLGLPTDPVLRGIRKAQDVGLTPVKVNAVVIRGVNDEGVVNLARHFKGTGVIVRFIEYMDVGSRNGWTRDRLVSAREIVDRISKEMPLEFTGRVSADDTSETWRYADGEGEVGVVASVTRPFCRGCTRARLAADGKLVTCLFASGGTDLRTLLRDGADDAAVEAAIRTAWARRDDRYSELRSTLPQNNVKKLEMYQLGG